MAAQANPPDGDAAGSVVVASADAYWISVQIDPAYEAALDADRLHRLACFVLQAEAKQTPLEVGISVTSDAEIHSLNQEYLGHDYPTDVLSFGADSPDMAPAIAFIPPPDRPTYLGDVVISYDTAAAQAADYGHSPAAEVDVLLVHGLLHLLGYDDQTPAAHAHMHARQAALLAAFARET